MVRYAAALSQHPVAVEAIGEALGGVLEQLDGLRPDLMVLVTSPHHSAALDDIRDAVRSVAAPEALIGCTAAMVAGGDQEVEDGPALSLWAAHWGGGHASTIELQVVPEPDGLRIDGWPDHLPAAGTLLLLADPFSFPTPEFLTICNRQAPHLSVVGGLASAGRAPGDNRLVVDGRTTSTGAVGVLLDARVPVWTAVSQGCQPVGRPFTVTASERNVVRELAGRSAIERLQEVVEALPTREYELLRSGIHVGIVVDEHKADFDRGDFLVRNVLGADADRGLTVGEFVDVGQTVQFHVRDAESAHDDLHTVVRRSVRGRRSALAALMFTCNGRGSNLFGRPNHDAALVHELADDDLCLTGMSCAGELGPVGGRTFLHGFTASLALFGDSLVLAEV